MRNRGQQLPYDSERKVRTAEHVIADLSYNFLEKKVLQRGHWMDSPRNDYGIDATMFHHNERGEIENGEVRIQLKASSRIKYSKDQKWIGQRVEMRDLRYWYFEFFPVILVVFDAELSRAYWLHVQDAVDRDQGMLESASESITMRVPVKNRLTLRSIDIFRKLSLENTNHLRTPKGTE